RRRVAARRARGCAAREDHRARPNCRAAQPDCDDADRERRGRTPRALVWLQPDRNRLRLSRIRAPPGPCGLTGKPAARAGVGLALDNPADAAARRRVFGMHSIPLTGRPSRARLATVARSLGERRRSSEMEALRLVDTELAEQRERVGVLDALGDRLAAEVVRERYDRLDDVATGVVAQQVAD